MAPLIIGHRGARGLCPENTLEGFRHALRLGVRAIEFDVGCTRDGVLVVHHDVALNPDIAAMDGRWPGGSLPLLRQMTLADLRDFEVGRLRPGSDYAARFPRQQPVDGARIPTLDEVLALEAQVRWYIELKLVADRPHWTLPAEEMVERVLDAVERAGAAERVVIQSFDWRAPRHARRLRPGIARAFLTEPRTIADPATWWGLADPPPIPEAIAAEGGGGWSVSHAELTLPDLARARGLGLSVVPWTVNAAGDVRRFAEWGVDGIITDYPGASAAASGVAEGQA